MNYEGYRDHSKIERTMFNSKFRYDIDDSSDLTITANVLDKPIGDDPGGLTRAQFEANPRQAQFANRLFDAGETVDQQQFGLLYRKAFNPNHEIIARNYHVIREFDNKVPGNSVTLDRYFLGGGLQYNYTDQFFGHNNRLVVGFDIDSQMDTRKNFNNTAGAIGALRLHQDEDVSSWGIFLQNEFAITENLELNFGARYDEVKFDFTDYFLVDGDGSGELKFEEWSPQAGLLWKVHEAVNVYGLVSTSFETPTSTEFVNPTGGGGFNQTLSPQSATNYEIGIKGLLPGRTSYQLSVFTMDVTNEILPAGINPAGNTFFNNAGETSRTGVEAAVTFRPLPGLDVSIAYTYSAFEFETFTTPAGVSFAGNHIPGVPEQFGYIEVAYFAPSGFYAAFDTQVVDQVFVNNANSDAAEHYFISNMRMGYTTNIGDTEFTPFFGVNNIFNRKYIGNVRVNEGNLRFFEPAPELNVFAGISLTFR
jgi:iron complex outermembrane receptor protein